MRVSLAIYDLLGRQVAVLVDDDLSAGDHVARFNAGGLGSGVYVYRLRAGEFRDAKRLVS